MKRPIAVFSAIAAIAFTASLTAQTAPPGPPVQTKPGLTLTTTAFEDGGIIPNKYTAAATAPGGPVSPPLAWSNVPDGVVSFVLKMYDPDSALNHRTDEVLHWLMFNIPGASRGLPEAVPVQAQLPDGSIQLPNHLNAPGFQGPAAGALGPYHHYTLELYALDTKLSLGPKAAEADVFAAMQGHILGKAVLEGRFHRP